MKKNLSKIVFCSIFLFAVFLLPFPAQSAASRKFDHTHKSYDDILKKFVSHGAVSYSKLNTDSRKLEQYLYAMGIVSEQKFNNWSKDQQLAFLINLYNASTLQLIIKNYPVKSIKDIGSFFRGPWDQPLVKLFRKTITLNHLEHKIIRKKYSEPRIHMALVCAAKGCPPLRSEAYVGEKLAAQLDDQTKRFLRNSLKFRIDRQAKVVYLSSIFKWYGKDFVGKYTPKTGFSALSNTHQAVLNFCSQYLSKTDRNFLVAGIYSVKFLNYDWSLNKRKDK